MSRLARGSARGEVLLMDLVSPLMAQLIVVPVIAVSGATISAALGNFWICGVAI